MLQDFSVAYNMEFISLRYFNAAGADIDGEIGEDHNPETHIIPLVLATALGKRSAVSIYGDDYDTQDGTCIRDYIHVSDLADAHVNAIQLLINTNQSKILNLGTGNGYSVREVINTAREITKIDIKEVIADRRLGDPARLVAQVTSAKKYLGWKPQLSNLENIIKSAWNWYTNNT